MPAAAFVTWLASQRRRPESRRGPHRVDDDGHHRRDAATLTVTTGHASLLESQGVDWVHRRGTVGRNERSRDRPPRIGAAWRRQLPRVQLVSHRIAETPQAVPAPRRMAARSRFQRRSSPAHREARATRADARVAPSASRMPISRVRCVTTNDITPYRPTSESSSASVPKLPESVASMRSVFNDRLTCSSKRAEVGDRQSRIGVVNDRSNRLKRCVWRSSNLHVEVTAMPVVPRDSGK